MKIKFKHIFKVINEGEFINAIIAYQKQAVEFKSLYHKKTGNNYCIAIRQRYFLKIDLWLFDIVFRWSKKLTDKKINKIIQQDNK